MVLIFLASMHILLSKNMLNDFFTKGKYILMTITYLVFIFLVKYGEASDLLDLLLTYLTATSFFVIGLYWGKHNKTNLLKNLFLILFVLTFLNLIPFVVHVILTGQIDKRALAAFYGLERSAMIMFWPYIFIIGFIGYYFHSSEIKKKWQKNGLNFLFVIYVLTMIVSAFTSVVLMLTSAVALLAYLKFKNKISFFRFFSFAFSIATLVFLLGKVADGTFGELGGTATKVQAVFAMFEAEDTANFEEQLDTASATRYSLLDISYFHIEQSPLLGNGYYFAAVGADINKQVASGHSSIVDFWAYFGVFAIPFFLIFINFISISYKFGNLATNNKKQMGYAICAVITTYFLISFSNPYLQFSSMDLIFLLGGFILAQYSTLKKDLNSKAIKYT